MTDDELKLEYYVALKHSKTIDLNETLYRQLTKEIVEVHKKVVKMDGTNTNK